jgi:hypothetical protein
LGGLKTALARDGLKMAGEFDSTDLHLENGQAVA